MSDEEYNRRVHQRMQEELAEYNTPSARYQQRLNQWWQSQRALEFEENDFYEVGGFLEQYSRTPSFHKSKRDSDGRLR